MNNATKLNLHRNFMQSFFVWAILIVVLLTLSVLSLALGAVPLSFFEVMTAVSGGKNTFIVQEYRLPRVLISLGAGAAFALSGTFLQAALRNPIASPDVIGITKGAGVGALFAVMLLPSTWIAWSIPIGVIIGSFCATIALLVIGRRLGGGVTTIALVGVAIGALAQAMTHTLIAFHPGRADQAMLWLSGTVFGNTGADVMWLFACLSACLPAIILMSSLTDIVGFGDDSLASLGINPLAARAALLVLSMFLTAVAVTGVGSIGFLGLMAPQIARRLVPPTAKFLLPTAALVGSILLLLADLIGRLVAHPNEIPAGIVTAVVGGPYLLFLLFWGKKTHG